MKRSVSAGIGFVLLMLTAPAVGRAQVLNGDFESGGVSWTTGGPVDWAFSFPAIGGNPDGHARIEMFGDSEGRGCVNQAFKCGQGGNSSCVVDLAWRLDHVSGSNDGGGRVVVRVDGVDLFVSSGPIPGGWQTLRLTLPCGAHSLGLCLEADAGADGWSAAFDAVGADCVGPPLPVTPGSWGLVKSLYR